jgi:hypothetical protein
MTSVSGSSARLYRRIFPRRTGGTRMLREEACDRVDVAVRHEESELARKTSPPVLAAMPALIALQ